MRGCKPTQYPQSLVYWKVWWKKVQFSWFLALITLIETGFPRVSHIHTETGAIKSEGKPNRLGMVGLSQKNDENLGISFMKLDLPDDFPIKTGDFP